MILVLICDGDSAYLLVALAQVAVVLGLVPEVLALFVCFVGFRNNIGFTFIMIVTVLITYL